MAAAKWNMEAIIPIMETLVIDTQDHRAGRDAQFLVFSGNCAIYGYCRMTHRFKKS